MKGQLHPVFPGGVGYKAKCYFVTSLFVRVLVFVCVFVCLFASLAELSVCACAKIKV